MPQFYSDTYQSPIGEMYLVSRDDALCFLSFHDNPQRINKLLQQRFGSSDFQSRSNTLKMRDRLDQYFVGEQHCFDGLKLYPLGTAFQQQVWHHLQMIPFGKTISYQGLAENIGKPSAARSVGTANGKNPLEIVIPCHRVIAKNGDLAGYADGVERKKWLITHESKHH